MVTKDYEISFRIIEKIDLTVMYEAYLDSSSPFYYEENGEYWYSIPTSLFSSLLSKNVGYRYSLTGDSEEGLYDIKRDVVFTGLSETEKIEESISSNIAVLDKLLRELNEEQKAQFLEAIELEKQQIENDKGILETIKDIVSYLNPFSENFFVYKLIELLGELLKDLFVPDSDYIVGYVNSLNEFFSDRFGLIYYPFDLVLSTMDKIVYHMTPPWDRPDASRRNLYL